MNKSQIIILWNVYELSRMPIITFCIVERHIQRQEILHCYHLCILRKHSMAGNPSLLSFLNHTKTSNVRKDYIAITFESWPKTFNVRKVYIAITFVVYENIQWHESLHCFHKDIQCQESLHCFHLLRKHPLTGKCTLPSLL